MEWEMKNVDEKSYRKAQRATNSRIISLGDDLWQFLRGNYVSTTRRLGSSSFSRPIARAPLLAALLHLYEDPKKSKNRDKTMQSDMKRNTIAAYHSLDVEKGVARCTLSGEYFDSNVIKAAHIVPVHLGIEMADYIFGEGTELASSAWTIT
ncbi:MAG: hypothetical protein M1839_001683 [Geoglossum umbratile]|nr:MAG: hypothetical protein M1839_001683 [Geoglossum umbratile]